MNFDVIVVGSGGAALTAAVSAATRGAGVAVFERTDLYGGTTAMSGGTLWIPNNRFMAAEGISDSKEEAFQYIAAQVNHPGREPLIRRFVDECNELLAFIEKETALRFNGSSLTPDYRPWLYGAKPYGRSVRQPLFDSNRLGELRISLRKAAGGAGGANFGSARNPLAEKTGARLQDAQERSKQGMVGSGTALIGHLLESCVQHGVALHHGTRAVELHREGGRVSGVTIERDGSREYVEAKLGVILACGGFEWNAKLVDRFLPAPALSPATHGYNTGDGVLMSMKVGASLGSMTEAWWNHVIGLPGELYDGRQHQRASAAIRGLPGMIMVNRRGRRFVNEAMNYHDMSKAMFAIDPITCDQPNLDSFIVFDAEYLAAYESRIYSTGTTVPYETRSEDRSWLLSAESLHELASRAGIDPSGLAAQIDEFNAGAARGVDPAYRRGESRFDHYLGDASKTGAAMNLRALGPGPFYAIRARLGTYGTKGGPMTNHDAQVLDQDDRPIPGLYAVGNTAAHVFGSGYPGAGATLGQGLTFGYVAGRAITAGH